MGRKWYQLLGAYLRAHWRFAAAQALFAAIFAAVLALYDAPAEAALYAACLCALVGAGALCVHFGRYLRRYRERQAAAENLTVMTDTPLPEAVSPGEEDFRQMAQRMCQAYTALEERQRQSMREVMDWFTVWVHQIKTPIAVMQLTLQGEDTAEHRALEAELFRVQQYAEMALHYLRLDGGTSADLVIASHSLDPIIRQSVRKYAPQFVQRRLYLRYDGADTAVLTDEKWLTFIIEQLLDNAVKYTDSGGVHISVSPEKVLRIADTGIGIAPEDLPRIFEKGFTGYNGRTDKTATGLGLYLCRRAADMLHHRLWAQSEPGRGSVFCLDLHTDPLEVE